MTEKTFHEVLNKVNRRIHKQSVSRTIFEPNHNLRGE